MIPRLRTAWAAHRRRVAETNAILAAADAACEIERIREHEDAGLARLLRDAIDAGIPVMADPERIWWASAMDAAAALRADVADPDARLHDPVLGCAWDDEYTRALGVSL